MAIIFAGVRSLSIYILVLLMHANCCFFHQLTKIPVLLQHYAEHQEGAHDKLDFFDFLTMHYWGQDIDDDDDDRDMQLPFKKMDHGSGHHVYVSVRAYSSPFTLISFFSVGKINYKKILQSNPHLGDLIKPPMA
ncbi:hypothetical protein SAMN02927921_02574 [Sinomicrobium oceani]|uniref:Uncharacterized protein n=1 Tax=Sinomicrobium oceani TaxID=1150368 RepID=A0A1K1QHC0_9FLAO|nr:hypothetical protein [Sinomicrobium oceani]SFW59352.1 hypothetical protein SAMN02927921_02574 [Sinomicrobium oceani]